MTAEIAIFNREAVVLAADSAVTITSGDAAKVYRSVSKIFALSARRPVAIMVFGAPQIMGIPWETIIKGYRDHLAEGGLDTIADYAEDFFSWAGGYLAHLDGDAVVKPVHAHVSALVATLEGMVEEAIEEIAEDGVDRRPVEDLLPEVLRNALTIAEDRIAACAPYVPLDDEQMAVLTRVRRDVVKHLLAESDLGAVCDASLRRRLHRVAQLALTRDDEGLPSPSVTGLVIAGFGEREIFPTLRAWGLSGLLTPQGPLRVLRIANDIDVATGKPDRVPAALIPFAQSAMVREFMEGMEPSLRSEVSRLARRAMEELAEITQNKLANLSTEYLVSGQEQVMYRFFEAQIPRMHERFERELHEAQHERHVSPVVDMLDALPREELANAAEALVSLQSLKHRMTMEVESVSGPIDVVTISKGDGLVWVKRK